MEKCVNEDFLAKTDVRVRTVGEHLDRSIREARERVERLCNIKAKAEALNVLQHPVDFYMDVTLA